MSPSYWLISKDGAFLEFNMVKDATKIVELTIKGLRMLKVRKKTMLMGKGSMYSFFVGDLV